MTTALTIKILKQRLENLDYSSIQDSHFDVMLDLVTEEKEIYSYLTRNIKKSNLSDEEVVAKFVKYLKGEDDLGFEGKEGFYKELGPHHFFLISKECDNYKDIASILEFLINSLK